MNPTPHKAAGCPEASADTADVLLNFGSAMLRSGNTASRTRERMGKLARKMGCDVSTSLSLNAITMNLRRADVSTTDIREVPAPGVDISAIIGLEQLARTAPDGVTAHEIAAEIAEIAPLRPLYSRTLIVVAVAAASASFAFLNGAAMPETFAAAVGGGAGQALRSSLIQRHFNQFAIAALAALAASGLYVVAAAFAARMGVYFANYAAGFMASVLFLVPGVPLIGGLFDLLHGQTLAALGRLVYGMTILLAVAFGLSIVIELYAIDLSRQSSVALWYPVTLLLRVIASFVAAGGLAILFNSPVRIALAAGVIGALANGLRLLMMDFDTRPAPAAFVAALLIGLITLFADYRFKVPPLATTVAATVIMVPGIYAFEMITSFNRNEMLDALQASAVFGFVLGALAMGLATARLFTSR